MAYLFKFMPQIASDIFIKNPDESVLGRQIIKYGVDLIAKLGFENFTFKKLAHEIGTTEASIYRYFDNKHKLLLYLMSWYWSWVEYRVVLKNSNIFDNRQKLKNIIKILTDPTYDNDDRLDTSNLFYIICNESPKAYLTKNVDQLNKFGVYFNYKKIVGLMSDLIRIEKPNFEYAHMLASTTVEGIHHQIFFKQHLPSLTDKSDDPLFLEKFYIDLVLTMLREK